MRTLKEEIARYFGVDLELAPHLATLLQDFDELGSDPALIVALLRGEGLAAGGRVLDLACGKGAVAVAIASELGVYVTGIDLLDPFIEEAKERAVAAGVADLCNFVQGDIRDLAASPPDGAKCYDALIYVAVGGVLGDLEATVGVLRWWVTPGGPILIDDGYRAGDEPLTFPGYEHCVSHAETLQQLTAWGDQAVDEQLISVDVVRAQNEKHQARIERRAAEIARSNPELGEALQRYIDKERQECQLLEQHARCSTWLLRRG